jgi:hypothetical protein
MRRVHSERAQPPRVGQLVRPRALIREPAMNIKVDLR